MTLYGDNTGIISVGDMATNVILGPDGFQQTPSLLELPLRPAPEVPPEPVRLFGREDLVERVHRQVRAGTSVQLYGHPGVGKKAVADAVRTRLAAEHHRGHLLLPAMGETENLETVYRSLAGLFFGQRFLRGIDESELREAVADVRDVLIAVYDCALSREDMAWLLRTFHGCTFLITSPYRTLPDPAAVHHVQPLQRDAAAELFSAELGLPVGPVGLRALQFDHAFRAARGRPQRLKQYAEFIKGSDDWRARAAGASGHAASDPDPVSDPDPYADGDAPHHGPPPADALQVSPRYQAEALAIRLSEPARQVLVALATFGVPLGPEWFAPVTGVSRAAAAGPELYDRRLVERRGGVLTATEDAVAAVRAHGWPATDPEAAAEGVLSALTAGRGGPRVPDPDPDLLLALARALDAAAKWAPAARFARTVLPVALRAGRKQTALELYGLGRKAALACGREEEIRFWVRTGDPVRTVLTGDQAAASAALLVLGGLLLSERPGAAAPAARVVRHALGRRNRRVVRAARRVLAAGHGAGAAGTAVAVAAVVAGAAVGVHALSSHPGTPAVHAGASAKPVGPGTDCGGAGSADLSDPKHTALDLVVDKGTTTCAAAFKAIDAYRHATNLQGSGGFGTVDGWSCSHQSIGTFLQSGGTFEECQKGGVDLLTVPSRQSGSSSAAVPAT